MDRATQKRALQLLNQIKRSDAAAFNSFERSLRYNGGSTKEREEERFENACRTFDEACEELEQILRKV